MIPRVPLDVVRVVLDHLRSLCKGHEAHANGLAIALVCKDWVEDGLKLAWERFTLETSEDGIALFVANAPLHALRLVRHLDLVDLSRTEKPLKQPLEYLVSQFPGLQTLTLDRIRLTVPSFADIVAGPSASALKVLTVNVELREQDFEAMNFDPVLNGLHSLVNLRRLFFSFFSKPEYKFPRKWELALPSQPKPRLCTLEVAIPRSTLLDGYFALLLLGAFDLSCLKSPSVIGSCTTIRSFVRSIVFPLSKVEPQPTEPHDGGDPHSSLRALNLTFNRRAALIHSLPSLLPLFPLFPALKHLTLSASPDCLSRLPSADPPPTLSPETPALSLAALHDALPPSVDLVTVRGVAFVLDVKTVVEIGGDDDGESEGLMVNEPGWAIQGCAQVWLQKLGAAEGEEGAVAREVVLLVVHADGRKGVTVLD
ncbi:hypothetical protein JCM8097_001568 [Rhodosporidiobolus ruineniae]